MSEFGKGFIYNLILFAKHFDRAGLEIECNKEVKLSEGRSLSLWINGVSDHLFELVIPENLPILLKEKIKKLQDIALDYGHGDKMMKNMTMKVYEEMRNLLNEIAFDFDEWLDINPEKADYD